jgi:hypothetical protein
MEDWQKEPDFANVRGEAALAELPEAEREPWRRFWAEVAATLAKAQQSSAPAEKSDKKP